MDGKNNVKLEVSFLKNERGDGWAVRVEGDAIDPCKFQQSSSLAWADRGFSQLNCHEQA